MIAGLNSVAPMYALTNAAVDADGTPDWSNVTWGGQKPDLSCALLAMKAMHNDEHAPPAIKNCVMLVLDGEYKHHLCQHRNIAPLVPVTNLE